MIQSTDARTRQWQFRDLRDFFLYSFNLNVGENQLVFFMPNRAGCFLPSFEKPTLPWFLIMEDTSGGLQTYLDPEPEPGYNHLIKKSTGKEVVQQIICMYVSEVFG